MRCIAPSLTIVIKAPFPVGQGINIGIRVCMNEMWESQKVGIHASKVLNDPIVILEIAIRGLCHGTCHVSGDEMHVAW
jgi:hypothetical protein